MENKPQIITTEQELQEYTELIFSDIGKALDQNKIIDKSLIKPIQFRIETDSEVPYITYSWMHIFTEMQATIYENIEVYIGRKLTPEEMKKIEVKVYVTKGSNLYNFDVQQIIDFFVSGDCLGIVKEISNMPTVNVLAITVPLAATIIGISLFKYKSTKLKISTDAQLKTKEIESEQISKELINDNIQDERKKNLEAGKIRAERDIEALKILTSAISIKEEVETKTSRYIKKNMSELEKFEVNGDEVTQEDLKEFAKRKSPKKSETNTRLIKGKFQTTYIDLNSDAPKVTIKGDDEEGKYQEVKNILISPDANEKMTPEILKAMEMKKDIYWHFTVTEEKGKSSFMITDISIPDETTDNI
ncbi:MAG: hypothetical protein WCQ76_06825 [Fusobacterium sp.]